MKLSLLYEFQTAIVILDNLKIGLEPFWLYFLSDNRIFLEVPELSWGIERARVLFSFKGEKKQKIWKEIRWKQAENEERLMDLKYTSLNG